MRLRVLLALAAFFLAATACGPLDDDEPQGSSPTGTPAAESAETLSPMAIVTRTPVDPAMIPTDPAETPEVVEIPSTYVVKEGDSLYSIAARFRLNLAEIVELNGLSDPNDISVGQELILPAPPE